MRRPFLPTSSQASPGRKALKHPELLEKIRASLEVGLALDIHWTEVDHLAVLKLALKEGLTTYDASYLYLARTLKIPLVTFNEELQRVTSG